jgi:CBS domain containing-hemolysin-like protein
MDAVGLLLVLVLIVITAFFVAVEFALVSVRRTRIEQLASEGNSSAIQVKRALDQLNTYLAAAQVGITMATIGLGTLGEPVVAQMFVPLFEAAFGHDTPGAFITAHGVSFVIALLIVTIVELILGETVPKIAAIQRAEAASLILIRPINFFMLIFRPFVWLINTLSNAVLRLLGLPTDSAHGNVYTVEELEMIVTSSRKAGVLDKEEEVILRRVFDFGDITARQVMRPRTELAAIAVDSSLAEVMQQVIEYKHSRFPVYEGSLDHIVGVLHTQDLFAVLAQDILQSSDALSGGPGHIHGEGFDVRTIMRAPKVVPETMDVADLLPQMQQSGVQMVVVIDEYGGTAGIVTLEDIIEEIVGEVRDEFEPESATPGIITTPEGTLIDGLVAIDDVNDTLAMGIESEADTIGGYVFEVLGRKPELGDEIRRNGYVLRVEKLDGLRIAQVRVLPHKVAAEVSEGDEDE